MYHFGPRKSTSEEQTDKFETSAMKFLNSDKTTHSLDDLEP